MVERPQIPVLIAGAGIAGLALALELSARGIQAFLIERESSFTDIGAGLQLPPNAGRILARHPGLSEALDRVSTRPEGLVLRNARSGKTVSSLPLGWKALDRWGSPYRVLHRADLHRALAQAVHAAGVRAIMGASVIGYVQEERLLRVTIRFNGRDESLDAKALVGADGLKSTVRRLMGDDAGPTFSRSIAWRALIDIADVPPALRGNNTQLWMGPGAHLVTYTVSGGTAVNAVLTVPGIDAEPGSLSAVFKHWHPDLRPLAERHDWTPWPLFERSAGRIWRKGLVALMGDAAHAMQPHMAQGAAQAIEDASALADSVQAEEDIEAALIKYEAHRRPRAARVQAESRANGLLYRLPSPAAKLRDLAMRAMSEERLLARLDWLYASGTGNW